MGKNLIVQDLLKILKIQEFLIVPPFFQDFEKEIHSKYKKNQTLNL